LEIEKMKIEAGFGVYVGVANFTFHFSIFIQREEFSA